jgi:hypothetical protein
VRVGEFAFAATVAAERLLQVAVAEYRERGRARVGDEDAAVGRDSDAFGAGEPAEFAGQPRLRAAHFVDGDAVVAGVGHQQAAGTVELGVVRIGQLAPAEAAGELECHRLEHDDAAVGHVGQVDQRAVGTEGGVMRLHQAGGGLGDLDGLQRRLRGGGKGEGEQGGEEQGAHGFPLGW